MTPNIGIPKIGQQITEKAIEILRNSPDGMRYTELENAVHKENPHFGIPAIRDAIWKLDKIPKNKISKPERGLYLHTNFKEKQIVTEDEGEVVLSKQKEKTYYEAFAEYLMSLEECSDAIPLGGKVFADRWGTPDVIGVEKPEPGDLVKSERVIVSAEVKIDSAGLITAFGQACAYRLFSHKVYIFIPKNSSKEDMSRVESLCSIFGIGLVLFDSESAEPTFEIRVRASKHEPDYFYVNRYMKLLPPDAIRRFFG